MWLFYLIIYLINSIICEADAGCLKRSSFMISRAQINYVLFLIFWTIVIESHGIAYSKLSYEANQYRTYNKSHTFLKKHERKCQVIIMNNQVLNKSPIITCNRINSQIIKIAVTLLSEMYLNFLTTLYDHHEFQITETFLQVSPCLWGAHHT